MKRFVVYIAASIACLVMPIIGILYGIWDSNQPKIGPVGDGNTSPTIIQLIPFFSIFLMGIINLPIAIIRYKKHKESKSREN
ncbi:hypothetical protein [Paenibacillus eucommiae]|uniref:Glycopeptide antibiotics resistance protein n=1 Tax=Paenibacillus eucommiae TaxID=1355755 RepID=A0ABS4IPX6_9BACL|nr:hypothetical protein [Paenibacillus eucommiae]MBP1989618.1 glycopeptide antibiotics resistance protein [Paenibacillus eucommiae]